MRNTFIHTLCERARSDERLFLIVGDLGFSVVEPFADQFPRRFLNAGVAEQNMTGVAAGLAMTGFNVFTYSIANFPTLRCFEQIRNDVAYHNLSVKVVTVGGGLAYGSLGYSHHAVQDIACLRTLPGMLMATPCTPGETRHATTFLSTYDGPAYLRLGRGGEPDFEPVQSPPLDCPGFSLIRKGTGQKSVIACGPLVDICLPVCEAENTSLYSTCLWKDDVRTHNQIADLVSASDRTVVVEEHLRAGGFGSFVRECLESQPSLQARVRVVALDPKVCGAVGARSSLLNVGGIDMRSIRRALLE